MKILDMNWYRGLFQWVSVVDHQLTTVQSALSQTSLKPSQSTRALAAEVCTLSADQQFVFLLSLKKSLQQLPQASTASLKRAVEKISLYEQHVLAETSDKTVPESLKPIFEQLGLPQNLFNQTVYEAIKQALVLRQFNQALEMTAVKLTVLFGDSQKATAYLDRAKANSKSFKNTHPGDFHLPNNQPWDVHFWRGALNKKKTSHPHDRLFRMIAFAHRIEAYFQVNHLPLVSHLNFDKHNEAIFEFHYPRGYENPAAAELFHQLGVSEPLFNEYIDIKISDEHLIPDITIQGSEVGHDHFVLKRLDKHDPRVGMIGIYTHCCEHMQHKKEYIHTLLEESFAELYVLFDETHPKDPQIVSHCIIYRDNDDNVVYTSVELSHRYSGLNAMMTDLHLLLADELIKHHGAKTIYLLENPGWTNLFYKITRDNFVILNFQRKQNAYPTVLSVNTIIGDHLLPILSKYTHFTASPLVKKRLMSRQSTHGLTRHLISPHDWRLSHYMANNMVYSKQLMQLIRKTIPKLALIKALLSHVKRPNVVALVNSLPAEGLTIVHCQQLCEALTYGCTNRYSGLIDGLMQAFELTPEQVTNVDPMLIFLYSPNGNRLYTIAVRYENANISMITDQLYGLALKQEPLSCTTDLTMVELTKICASLKQLPLVLETSLTWMTKESQFNINHFWLIGSALYHHENLFGTFEPLDLMNEAAIEAHLTRAYEYSLQYGELKKMIKGSLNPERFATLFKQLCHPLPYLGMDLLIDAVVAEKLNIIELIIQSGFDMTSLHGNTTDLALGEASRNNRPDIILKVLLEAGMNPNVRNSMGTSPLFSAVFNQNQECLSLLLAYGANVRETLRDTNTTIMHYIYYLTWGSWVPYLMACGFDMNAPLSSSGNYAYDNQTPLALCKRFSAGGNLEVVAMLQECTEINDTNKNLLSGSHSTVFSASASHSQAPNSPQSLRRQIGS